VNIGKKLRHRVTIQQRTNTRNATTGEDVITWTDLHTCVPAAIEPLSVREFITSKSENTQLTARIVIRYKSGLDSSVRIVHGSKIYNPQGFLADPDSGIEYLTAPCSEGTNTGE
jgi:SPP1 family predicted phage head-tail adaptor